ncbi:19328_t:CDS:2, partial [Racocetra persica]
MFYQDVFIVLVKKRLGFNKHSIGTKQVSIHAFPENIFVFLFESEPSFCYSPVQRKYSCFFQGEAGEQRLKQLINYDNWNIRQDPKLKTIGYVLFVDNESSYEVNFSWSQSEVKENNHIFQCSTVTCKFVADSGEFSQQPAVSQMNHITPEAMNLPQMHEVVPNKDFSSNGSTQKNYRFILSQ